MDLLATVRKDGPRGGRGEFKWSDVQGSTHRENYLGHSLMAPVGRWQRGRDLNWYAKGDADASDGDDPAERAAQERKEEIRRIKAAEEDALARALGFDVAPRNPNMEALSDKREVDKVLKEAAAEEDDDNAKGVGFGRSGGRRGPQQQLSGDRIEEIEVANEGAGVAAEKGQEIRNRADTDTLTAITTPNAGRGRGIDITEDTSPPDRGVVIGGERGDSLEMTDNVTPIAVYLRIAAGMTDAATTKGGEL